MGLDVNLVCVTVRECFTTLLALENIKSNDATLEINIYSVNISSLHTTKGLSDVCSFWTCILRSVLRPQVVGHSSHWKIGFVPL